MPVADTSQTERIRRIRGKIQAVRRAECKACPELGPQGPTTESIALSRKFGQMTYYRQLPSGAVVEESCCAPSSVSNVCVQSTVTYPELTTVTITNPYSTQIYVVFNVGGSKPPPPVIIDPGDSAIVSDILGYTIYCMVTIDLTCQSTTGPPPPLPSVLFLRNTDDINYMSVSILLQNGMLSTTVISPNLLSYPILDISSYSMDACDIPVNINLECDLDVSQNIPTIVTFTNTSGGPLELVIYFSDFIALAFLNNGESTVALAGILRYTTSCSPGLQDNILKNSQYPDAIYTIIKNGPPPVITTRSYIEIVCNQDVSYDTPNIITFINESGADLTISIYLDSNFAILAHLNDGDTIGPFATVTHYTTESCTQVGSDIMRYMQRDPDIEYTIINMDPAIITSIQSGKYIHAENGFTLIR